MTADPAATRGPTVRILATEAERRRWDEWIVSSPQADPFATTTWLSLGCAVTGADHEIHVVERGQEWIGGVAHVTARRLGVRTAFGLPLAAYNTVLFRPPTSGSSRRTLAERQEVVGALLDAARLPNATHLLSPSINDVRPWTWRGWRAIPRYTHVLDVSRPLELSDSARRHVRKCREAGMTTSLDWDLARFGELFASTRERQRFGIRLDRSAFEKLAGGLHAAGLAWMVTIATDRGEPAASQIVLGVPSTPRAYMWTAGARSDLLATGVSTHVMNEIAAEAGRRGFRAWDLCGADLPGVARFKAELGGELVPYFQVDAPRSLAERVYALTRRVVRRFLPAG